MELALIAFFAIVLCVYLVAQWPFDVGKKSDRQLVHEHTVYLHKKSLRERTGRLAFTSSRESTAAAELRRRGFDPDKAVGERFDAKREGRPMRWNSCRIDGATATKDLAG